MEKKKVLLAIKGLFSAAFVTSAGYKINRGIGKRQSAKVADSVDSSYENSIGFNDVNVNNNRIVHSNNFVILHVGKDTNISVLSEKIQFCNEHNISVGIVVDSNAGCLSKVYQEVENINFKGLYYRKDICKPAKIDV